MEQNLIDWRPSGLTLHDSKWVASGNTIGVCVTDL